MTSPLPASTTPGSVSGVVHRGVGADLGWVQAYMHKAHADCHSHSNMIMMKRMFFFNSASFKFGAFFLFFSSVYLIILIIFHLK